MILIMRIFRVQLYHFKVRQLVTMYMSLIRDSPYNIGYIGLFHFSPLDSKKFKLTTPPDSSSRMTLVVAIIAEK